MFARLFFKQSSQISSLISVAIQDLYRRRTLSCIWLLGAEKKKMGLLHCLFAVITALILQAFRATSVVVPSSHCYVFDNSSRILDFTSQVGKPFEYDSGESDLVVRFCKDVESRSKSFYHNFVPGYVDFGRFEKFNDFVAGSGQGEFVQGFYNGDLNNCEVTHDKMGRTAQSFVDLAIQCETLGPRVFRGFTVGFHPRTWEIVYDGMTQLGFEKCYHDFSFTTEQTHVALYITAIASLSTLVPKPMVKTIPDNGLEVTLSCSGAAGKPPTTLSPTLLAIDWKCEKARDAPYEVNITFPIEGYEPVQFMLTKMCDFRQDQAGNATRGWAIFGILSCIFFVLSTLFCCGGFIYKTRVEHQHGIDALPGMTILSACLDTVSRVGQGYTRAEDINNAFASDASWERPPVAAQGTNRQAERKHGAI